MIHSNALLAKAFVTALLLFLVPNQVLCDCPFFVRTALHDDKTRAAPHPLPPNHRHEGEEKVESYTSAASGFPPRDVLEAYGAAVLEVDWDEVRSDLRQLFRDVSRDDFWPSDYNHYGGLFVRLTWHCTGSYRLSDGRGGCDGGNQRFDPERSWADNTNLDKARALLEPIKLKHGLGLSHGDLYVLAGTEAIRDMGGPTLGFCGGRIDTVDNSQTLLLGPTPEQEEFMPCGAEDGDCRAPLGQNTMGLIYVNPEGPFGEPDAVGAAETIRDVFGRMTMTDRENVALIGGGHTFGKTHGACVDGPGKCGATGRGNESFTSGFEGPWTSTPTQWDNQYMRNLVDYQWESHMGPGGHYQWRVKGHDSPKAPAPYPHNSTLTQDIMMLTTDVALSVDPSYSKYVREFAQDADAFSRAFEDVWYKLTARDMGPHSRCVGPDVPPPQPFQNPLPDPIYPLADMASVEEALHDLVSNSSATDRGEYLRLAWQCASTFRITDYLGGCNGARIRLAPGRDWLPNTGLDRILKSLEPIKKTFGDGLSWADLIVMAGNIEFMQLMDISPQTWCDGDANVNTPCSPLVFCQGRTDAIEGEDHGWDNLAFGNDAYPSSINSILELNSRRGLSVKEFVALSWPMHYAALNKPLSTKYLYDILMDTSIDCGDILTCGLKNHPEIRVWVDYYINFGDQVFAQDVATVWTKMMNIDRFDGPTGNVCSAQDNLYIMQMVKLENDDTAIDKSTRSFTLMTFSPHRLSSSSLINIASTDEIIVDLLTLIGAISLVYIGIWCTLRFTRR